MTSLTMNLQTPSPGGCVHLKGFTVVLLHCGFEIDTPEIEKLMLMHS